MPGLSTDDRMAQLENTSAILGEYMLRGYTLTDLCCDKCHVTPLMREPAAAAAAQDRAPVQFCAQCDGRPDSAPVRPVRSVIPAPKAESDESDEDEDGEEDSNYNARAALYASASVGAAGAAGAGSGSPGQLSIPTSEATALYASTSRAAPRVEEKPSRSDEAAESISTLLLQGYSLLAENCPQPACKGIPLVGYPRRKDGGKDGRRMCVSCGSAWVDEGALEGLKMVDPSSRAGGEGGESPRSKARRELYETGEKIVAGKKGAEKGKAREELPVSSEGVKAEEASVAPSPAAAASPSSNDTLAAALSHTSASLASTLDRLATSLDSHAPGDSADQARYFVDVKLHTEAIKDVLGTLSLLDRLRV